MPAAPVLSTVPRPTEAIAPSVLAESPVPDETVASSPLLPAAFEAPSPSPPPPPPPPPGPRSQSLRDGRFHDPMPGGDSGGWYGDTGLDIAGNHLPVYAVAAGILDY